MRPRGIVIVALAAVLSGCGRAGAPSGDFEGTEAQVAEAVERLETTGARQASAGEICRELLTAELAQRLARDASSCDREIREAIADADLAQVSVTDVSVSGDSATAAVESSSGETRVVATVEMARERGDWRIAGIRSQR